MLSCIFSNIFSFVYRCNINSDDQIYSTGLNLKLMFASEHLGKPISIQITGLYNCEEQMDIFGSHIIIWVGLINGNFERLNLLSLWISIMDLLLHVNASDILCLMYYELFIFTELRLTTLILTTWQTQAIKSIVNLLTSMKYVIYIGQPWNLLNYNENLQMTIKYDGTF